MKNGFTLIEMMVALAIFAILSAAGVMLLRGSADTQLAVEQQLTTLSSTERLRLLLSADLGQALNRPTRAGDGSDRPAFVGTANEMRFVRGGFEPVGDDPAPSIARIAWTSASGDLTRRQFGRLDGADDPVLDAALIREIDAFALSYRNASGGWVGAWPDGSDVPLPLAVRIDVTVDGLPLELVIDLPASTRTPQQLTPDAPAPGERT